jgi:acyl carrier protein
VNVDDRVKNDILEFVVASWLSGDARGLDGATDLQEAGVLDSFSMLTLVGFLEETYGVQLDPADINPETFRTVDAIAGLVHGKLRAKE